jgi:aryl-alcohol dehydrogenase
MPTVNTVAAVYSQPEASFALECVTLDALRDDEVLVRNHASGICHTDVLAQSRVALPAVLGHEGAGVVEAIGPRVTRVRVGDRVVVSYPWCGACSPCHEGEPFHCDQHMSLAFGGGRPDGSKPLSFHDGRPLSSAFFQQSSFARHSITTERAVVPVRDGGGYDRLAALACGIQTGAGSVLNTFRVGPLDGLAVFGVGAVGMSAVLAGKVAGAWPLIAIDVLQERLELAKELGASHVVHAARGNVRDAIREIAPKGVRYALETSGVQQSLDDAIACLSTGGECGMVIAPHLGRAYPFSPSEVFTRAASLRGIIQGSAVPATFIPKLLDLQRQGRFPYERLITQYRFEDINKAFADVKNGRAIKPVLLMSE